MPRTYVWSEATPAGSDDANTLDDAVRRLRLELREIINQTIGVGVGTALQDPVVGFPANNYLLRPGTSAGFYPVTYQSLVTTAGAYVEYSQAVHGAGAIVAFDLSAIPVGATITKLEIFMSSDNAGSSVPVLNLNATKLATGAAVTSSTAFDTGVGAFTNLTTIVEGSHTPAGGILLDGTTTYAVVTNITGPAGCHIRVHGLLVTYTRPSIAVIR